MPEMNDSSGKANLTLGSDLEELERLRAFLEGFFDRESVPEPTRTHLNIALEELVVNAIKHGICEPRNDAIRLAMSVEDGEVHVTLSDSGVAFNPLLVEPPDLSPNLLRRPVGGLGIHLVRCLIPSIRYERRDGRNYLYLTKPVNREYVFDREEGDANADCTGDHPG